MSAIATVSMERLAQKMRIHAATGNYFYDGRNVNTPYFRRARQLHLESGTSLLFTRDKGMHSSGWFKNQDFERCYHLSISFWDLTGDQEKPAPYDYKLARVWIALFYPLWQSYIWEESSALPNLPSEVRHYRVLCDSHWRPILPRGEVYSRDLIEAGWKSFSDAQGDRIEIVNKLIDRLD